MERNIDISEAQVIRYNYGRTNTFLIQGTTGRLLVDTEYAGTLTNRKEAACH